jgi:hypothetical protein
MALSGKSQYQKFIHFSKLIYKSMQSNINSKFFFMKFDKIILKCFWYKNSHENFEKKSKMICLM